MALIKCPECKKEISDTVKKCPHCGFNLKKDKIKNDVNIVKNKVINKVGKKVLVISGISLAILVVIIGIILFITTAVSRKEKKMIKYLESVGFSCRTSEYGQSCLKFNNGISKTMFVEDGFSISYEVESNNEYKIVIRAVYYSEGHYGWQSKAVQVKDEYYNETCFIVPERFEDTPTSFRGENNHFEIGDKTKGDYNCEYDFSSKVDEALREFESYFSGAGIELGK